MLCRVQFGVMLKISPLSLVTKLMETRRAHATGRGHVNAKCRIICGLRVQATDGTCQAITVFSM
jgi:hypothetical protein